MSFNLWRRTTSRYKEKANEELWEKDAFKKEAKNASEVLRVSSLKCFGFDANRFDTLLLLDIIKVVEKTKNEIKPDLIITHSSSDLIVGHRLTHQAVMTAFHPDIESNRFRITTFESLSSTEYQDQAMSTFRPNCYVDIKAHLS